MQLLPTVFLCDLLKNGFTCFPANVGEEFFEVKQHWAPFLPKFSRIFSRNFGILFGFSGILPKFSRICPNFRRFCPNFQQIKFFGGALAPLHPHLLHHWPPNLTGWIHLWFKMGVCPSLGIGTKNLNFLENLTSAVQFRLIHSFLAMAVY